MSIELLRETLERARSLIGQRYTPGEGKGISEITEFFAKDWSRGLEQFADHYHDPEAAAGSRSADHPRATVVHHAGGQRPQL